MSSIKPSPEFETSRPRLSLDGQWTFSYDADDVGVGEKWFAADKMLPEQIAIPGCSQAHDFASAGGYVRDTDVYIPEQSRTIMLKYGCMSPSWYQRRFTVPREWEGQRVLLRVGGVKPAAEFWINGESLGSTLTSRSPISCDLTPHLNYGEENTVTVRIHWPDLRLDGVFDVWHAWSGLYRSIWGEAVPEVSLADIHISPSIEPAAATFAVTLSGEVEQRQLRVTAGIRAEDSVPSYSGELPISGQESGATASGQIAMPGAKLWSPNSPTLYHATVRLYDGDELLDEGTVRFGLREVSTRGHQVLLNGKPIFLRGGGDDQIYTQTVCPPADKAFFVDRISKAKKYGYNYVKSAVEIFTREYLEAADELGYLVCTEMPFGCQAELRALREHPTPEATELWLHELVNIVTSDRSHPSVVAYSMASELDVSGDNLTAYEWFCVKLPHMAKQLNPAALIFDVTGGLGFADETRHGPRCNEVIDECIENAYYLTPLYGRLPIPDEVTKPFFLHEWNWTASLPHPDIIKRYEDVPLEVVQVPEMVETARANDLLEELPEMAERSRLLKHVLRKDAYEQAFSHPKIAGFHGWLIHDVSYCPEGILNEFWEEPEDLSAEEYRTYNDDTVLIIEDNDKRNFFYGQAVPLGLTVVHFGEEPLAGATLRWRLLRGEEVVVEGTQNAGDIACGQRLRLESLGVNPLQGETPCSYDLVCELWTETGKACWNHWTLWFFPSLKGKTVSRGVVATQPLPLAFDNNRKPYSALMPPRDTDVFITHRLRDSYGDIFESVIGFIEEGGRVLLLSQGVLKESQSCFYRTVPYNLGSTGNMGTVIRSHPALGDFPHEGWCDLSFVPLIQGASPMSLEPFKPQKINPIIRSIGHHVTMEDKAYLFEVAIGKGVLLACSLNIQPQCHVDPAAHHLYYCLLQYLAEGNCSPGATITSDQFRAAIK